jgi:cysteine desulfurase
MQQVYFDYAATSPVDQRVVEAMAPFWTQTFGNSNSPHRFGQAALAALEDSRRRVARFLGASAEEIVFTSGASEAANHVIFQAARSRANKGKRILVSAIEHSCIREPALQLSREGFDVVFLPVNPDGIFDPGVLHQHINDQTTLVAVMHANNEIGTIQPVQEISRIVHAHGALFCVDTAQSVGQIPVSAADLGADFMIFSGHKLYAPKGIGALFIRKGIDLPSYILGGDQESGRRASTQNVAGAVAMAKAVEILREVMPEETRKQMLWRDRIFDALMKSIPDMRINGHRRQRIARNIHVAFDGISGQDLLLHLDMAGIAASMGSACMSGAIKPSHVLKALGVCDQSALGALRLTTGRFTKDADVDYLLEQLPFIVKKLRR